MRETAVDFFTYQHLIYPFKFGIPIKVTTLNLLWIVPFAYAQIFVKEELNYGDVLVQNSLSVDILSTKPNLAFKRCIKI